MSSFLFAVAVDPPRGIDIYVGRSCSFALRQERRERCSALPTRREKLLCLDLGFTFPAARPFISKFRTSSSMVDEPVADLCHADASRL